MSYRHAASMIAASSCNHSQRCPFVHSLFLSFHYIHLSRSLFVLLFLFPLSSIRILARFCWFLCCCSNFLMASDELLDRDLLFRKMKTKPDNKVSSLAYPPSSASSILLSFLPLVSLFLLVLSLVLAFYSHNVACQVIAVSYNLHHIGFFTTSRDTYIILPLSLQI